MHSFVFYFFLFRNALCAGRAAGRPDAARSNSLIRLRPMSFRRLPRSLRARRRRPAESQAKSAEALLAPDRRARDRASRASAPPSTSVSAPTSAAAEAPATALALSPVTATTRRRRRPPRRRDQDQVRGCCGGGRADRGNLALGVTLAAHADGMCARRWRRGVRAHRACAKA